MAMPQPIEVPCEASPALGEDDEVDGCPCWGGMLKGTSAQCTPGFTSGKAHFKNKFCAHCTSAGFVIPIDRIRALAPGANTTFSNTGLGLWSRTSGGDDFQEVHRSVTAYPSFSNAW